MVVVGVGMVLDVTLDAVQEVDSEVPNSSLFAVGFDA